MTQAISSNISESNHAIDEPQPRERINGELAVDSEINPCEPSEILEYINEYDIPTMLVPRELNYLKWIASELKGTGRVVELGCFLGGSTSALVDGMLLSNSFRQSLNDPLTSNQLTKSILSYDSFEAYNDQSNANKALLSFYDLVPGQHFREVFEQRTQPIRQHIDIREGWIPADADPDLQRKIYPEQEPIELLFVDAAKTWDVHSSILRTFAKHLRQGSTVIQQDFCDMNVPWLPLHMWQLRDVLEPMDVIHTTPTVSFRCVGDVESKLDSLWNESDFATQSDRNKVWDTVYEYWSSLIGPDKAGFLYGHAAMHAFHAQDWDETARLGRMYEIWGRSNNSRKTYFTPSWHDFIVDLPNLLRESNTHSEPINLLALEVDLRGPRATIQPRGYVLNSLRYDVWTRLISELRSEGHKKIALFGGGKHTSWLMSQDLLQGVDLEVVCIIDDEPSSSTICGIPVVTPEEAHKYIENIDVMLPSSDSFQDFLLARIDELYPSPQHFQILPAYQQEAESVPKEHEYRYSVLAQPNSSPTQSIEYIHGIAESIQSRIEMGLSEKRSWLPAFYERYRVPEWVAGCINQFDAAFFWDMIEMSQPRKAVEIGTASGVSTAMLLAGANDLCAHDVEIRSYDIATNCYFESSRPLGSAIGEMVPELVDQVSLFSRHVAANAAAQFGIGEIDLAFIDGNHKHPAPTFDVLALLYAMRPNGWIVLHDIELCNLNDEHGKQLWENDTGPHRLFNSWPFQKIQPSGESVLYQNMGAIQIPSDPMDALPHLTKLFEQPWDANMINDRHTEDIHRSLKRLQ
jgi:predicted O-methyltransferase YrrM